ncbi:MAG: tRNA (adenosine(37)-N6)-threonylcarbamoyltransferase complex transferase subunit TsaD [Patescibacteria group bacterium]|jgi:N6-L-threonylcarbamoyladenine synthase
MSKKNKTIILGIESSCDETAAALVKVEADSPRSTRVVAGRFKILAGVVASQIKIHQKFGGVVPEVAARNHVKNILPVVSQALAKAKIKPAKIDKIAVTTGPGLITSLMVGTETAKVLAYAWKKPICSINHLKAHLYANWLTGEKIKFPAICLIVSGGHTDLILVKNQTTFKKIGQTIDDAAGEAFDKVAQLLKIGYPGGPIISQLAKKGNPKAFNFARPMINSDNFNFSFSGLKTSVLYTVQKLKKIDPKITADLCASFQQAAIDVLTSKTMKAAINYQAKTIMISGGVAANKLLRQTMEAKAKKAGLNFLMPDSALCTDNAAMIAVAGYFTKPTAWQKLRVDPNWEL